MLTISFVSKAGAQEIRAFWVDGFADGFKTPEQVDLLLARLRKANCNAVFAQMRKSADAYYLSRYDVWASDNTQRFDALQYLIDKAHSRRPRIQVHAWLNTFAVGKDRGNPFHITRTHPEWISLSEKRETHDGEATKLDPGHPEAADYTFRVYMDVLRHYDVDGIHFDFVRYGGPNWGYNPVSVDRFNRRHGRTGDPAPADPLWKQWRRDQVTALVRKVYAMASAVKPKAQVSAATITWQDGPRNLREWEAKSAAMNRVFQDWRSWMKEGILDLNCLMSYYDERRHPDWYRRWLDWAKDNQFGRHAALANGSWLNLIPDSFSQVAAIRNRSVKGNRAKGVMLYCYAATNKGPDGAEQRFNEAFYSALSSPSIFSQNPPFAKLAAYPSMSWKSNPKAAILRGFVFRGNRLDADDGIEVTIRGKRVQKKTRTDGTGFFAFVGLAPGEYVVGLDGLRNSTERVRIEPGRSVGVTLMDPRGPAAPVFNSISTLFQIGDFSPVTISNLVVVGGTDTIPGRLLVTDSARSGILRIELNENPVLALQSGDEVIVRGRWEKASGEPNIFDAHAQLIGIKPDSEVSRTPPFITAMTGRVREAGDGAFLLDSDGLVEVVLGPRKGPGIEEPAAPVLVPAIDSTVRVTGILTEYRGVNGAVHRLHPRTADDLQVITSAAANMAAILSFWAGIALASGLLTYGLLRRFSRRTQPAPS